jgi:hypothetical protein
MLNRLIEAALAARWLVLTVVGALIAGGLYAV